MCDTSEFDMNKSIRDLFILFFTILHVDLSFFRMETTIPSEPHFSFDVVSVDNNK